MTHLIRLNGLLGLLYCLYPLWGYPQIIKEKLSSENQSRCSWFYQKFDLHQNEPIQLLPFALRHKYGRFRDLFFDRADQAELHQTAQISWQSHQVFSWSREVPNTDRSRSKWIYTKCQFNKGHLETAEGQLKVWSSHPFTIFLKGGESLDSDQLLPPFSALLPKQIRLEHLIIRFQPWLGKIKWGVIGSDQDPNIAWITPNFHNVDRSVKSQSQSLVQSLKLLNIEHKNKPLDKARWLKQIWKVNLEDQVKVGRYFHWQQRIFIPFTLITDIQGPMSQDDVQKISQSYAKQVKAKTQTSSKRYSYHIDEHGLVIELQQSLSWLSPLWSLEWDVYRSGQVKVESIQANNQEKYWISHGMHSHAEAENLIWQSTHKLLIDRAAMDKAYIAWSNVFEEHLDTLYSPIQKVFKSDGPMINITKNFEDYLEQYPPRDLSINWIKLSSKTFQKDLIYRPSGLQWRSSNLPQDQKDLWAWWTWLEEQSLPTVITYPNPVPSLNPLGPEAHLLARYRRKTKDRVQPILWSPKSDNALAPKIFKHWGYYDSLSNQPKALNHQVLPAHSRWVLLDKPSKIQKVSNRTNSLQLTIKLQLDQDDKSVVWSRWNFKPHLSPSALNRLIQLSSSHLQLKHYVTTAIPDQLKEFNHFQSTKLAPLWWSQLPSVLNRSKINTLWQAYLKKHMKKGRVHIDANSVTLSFLSKIDDILVPHLRPSSRWVLLNGATINREVLVSSDIIKTKCRERNHQDILIKAYQILLYKWGWEKEVTDQFIRHHTQLNLLPSRSILQINKHQETSSRRIRKMERDLCINSRMK